MSAIAECKKLEIGRWILCKSERYGELTSQTPFYVTRVEKKRVYIQCRDENNNLVDSSFKIIKSVAFVFETEEQAIQAAEKCKAIYESWAIDAYKDVVQQTASALLEHGGEKLIAVD